MSGNSGAWGIAMWRDGYSEAGGLQLQEQGISLEGGDPILPYLPTTPLGCLLVPPAGLGVPGVRSGDVAFAQRDGVVQFADYYEGRQITLQVLVKNDACPGCSSAPQIDGALVLNGVAPGRAFTPHSPSLNITGDPDLRVHLAMDDWTPSTEMALVGKWAAAGERSYLVRLNTGGTLTMFWTEDGTAVLAATSTAAPTVADGDPLWIGVEFDVDNGAGGRDITFLTSTDGVTWTQLGSTVTQAGTTSIHEGTSEVAVGAIDEGVNRRLEGRVFSVEIRDGIGGTIVASPNFAQPAGTGSFLDGQGNLWTVVSPAYLQPFVAEKMSARQKVSRLTQEWSRNCSGASLVLFTDCHNPDAIEEEKIYNGPYLVHGRPRVADVVWERSNRGAARVTLRFDAADARLILASTPPGQIWNSEQVQTIEADEQNLAPDPDLSGLTMTVNGATVVDSYPATGGPSGPDGGPYFSRFVSAVPTSSPHTMPLTPSGTGALPVDPADVLSVGWWARKMNPSGGIPQTRLDWTWYDAGGGTISSHTSAGMVATDEWQRFTEENIIAPALAEFVQFRLAWTGIPGTPGYTLNLAQAWINEGATVTEPETVEIVGTLCACPVITLFPDMTAPIVVTYGNHEFTYNEDVTSVIDIDTRWGRASDGSTDVTQNLSGDFTSCLEPGVHDVTVQTADPTDTGSVNIVWENAVVSG